MLVVAAAVFPAAASSGHAADGVGALAGRYSHHWKNGDVQGNTCWTDDVAGIVPINRDAAHVRVELAFLDDHGCPISGVGTFRDDAIVYRDRSGHTPPDAACVPRLSHRGTSLVIDVGDGGCKPYCGMRGPFNGIALPWTSRRPITHLVRLRSSRQYRDALRQWTSR